MSKDKIPKAKAEVKVEKIITKPKPKVKAEKVEVKVDIKKKKEKVKEIDGRKIGNSKIRKVEKIVQNGSEYNMIHTIDGLTFILNDVDFEAQVRK